ncbi:VWA domain-containing protein [bacterium]|nr:VWA domain-containing protein [bacterium]
MKLKKLFVLVTLLVGVFFANQAFSYTPLMYKIIIDTSGSVSQEDFQQANRSVAAFLEILYERSQLHPGEAAEFISVSWFGSKNKYASTPFYNCSGINKVRELQAILVNARHPDFGSTAIYTAIARGTIEAIEFEKSIGKQFPKFMIVMTDGEENDSPDEHKKLVRQIFPNRAIYLSVIGVGSGAKIDEFKDVAQDVRMIGNINEFYAALLILSEAIGK